MGAVFPDVEVRYQHAVIVLAEELNFTRAADRLHITQSTLSKQITELEERHKVHLFTRDNKRVVELTDAGRIFVEGARSSLLNMERTVQLARAAQEEPDNVLTIGHSPYADEAWVSAILAIRLPLYPKLRIQLISEFAIELVRSVLAGELDLALVTAPPENSQITVVPFALTPLYAVLPQTHAAAQKEHIVLQDLAHDEWILLARRVHPFVHDAIMDVARCGGIRPKHAHDIITAQEAVHLVSERVGVAILTQPTALGVYADGVVVKPLSDASLCFQTCVIMRADDDSRLTNEFARSFLRKYAPQRPPRQLTLPLPA
jgi:DNA-binding transcriptional LysR family regulator